MAQAKATLIFGAISFCGEGEQTWLGAQISKLVAAALSDRSLTVISRGGITGTGGQARTSSLSFSTYLKIGGNSSQVQRFLLTAAWLSARGATHLTARGVSRALKVNHQAQLSNAADCLNKNVAKGFCKKEGAGFVITLAGWDTVPSL